MKSYDEMYDLILKTATEDDYYAEPYDYNGRSRFAYLTQYKDGNRIDLTFIDVSEIGKQAEFSEPRTVLANKDDFKELVEITSKECFYIKKPSEFEFFGTVNEFRWISNYVTKGLCRHEFYYARRMMEEYMMNMFLKMINWKIGIDNDFQVTTGACCKYLKNYLTEEEMTHFEGMFPSGDYEDMWEKLFLMYDFFEELSVYVAEKLGFPLDLEESNNVREFMAMRRAHK
ncbi:aminoglycoside 6-adenylyltransferase [Butyrivibrio sp. AD3002]|uniref:aminoglycoside 6-adenylyltransferase n=1 Tax=Butyrivibrio sp. AD3002 TaxID=1280670 RepID=UPI0003B3B2AE|nr:aminoglycoside 6-adenylyltransferase [Butyrivibrio sp. AD3002]